MAASVVISGKAAVFNNVGDVYTYEAEVTGNDASTAVSCAWSVASESSIASITENTPDTTAVLKLLKSDVEDITITCVVTCIVATVSTDITKTFTVKSVQKVVPSDRITADWALAFLSACSADVQARFAALSARKGITISASDTILRSEQIALLQDAI